MKKFLLGLSYSFLAYLSHHYICRHNIVIIGVTGSVGKTTCRQILYQVLVQLSQDSSPQKRIYSSPKNYNSELGFVLSVFQIEDYNPGLISLIQICLKVCVYAYFGKKNTDILIAEYGIDAPGDMDHLLRIAHPDIAILTKLDHVHSANFPGGADEYWKEKWKLIYAAKQKTFINLQDQYSQKLLHSLKNYEEIFHTPITTELQYDENKGIFSTFQYRDADIFLHALGEENVEYTLLALKISEFLSFRMNAKQYHIELTNTYGRFSVYTFANNIYIDATYNAAPESMRCTIQNAYMLQKELFPTHKIIFVLGDMRELGDYEQQAHNDVAGYIQKSEAVFFIGPLTQKYSLPALQQEGYTGEIYYDLSARRIGKKVKEFLVSHTQEKYILVCKGSQNTIFVEEALRELLPQELHKNLPRQSNDWKVKKEKFFSEV